jgi:GT2 family glycosyltransferase
MGLKTILKKYINKYQKISHLENEYKTIDLIPFGDVNRKKITFKSFEDPKVSIIIPLYNEEKYTYNCLDFLSKYLTNNISYEILLIDDNSSESNDFSNVQFINIHKNKENLGFLKNINLGINKAKGEYIYILNNNTEVQKDFLEELFHVFDNFENVGAVGSKLINADLSLQGAGSVFLKDCSIHNIENSKKVYYPDINYIKKVDYCSGCSLLFKKYDDNGNINQFDEQFVPTYFEETDFCFQLNYLQNKHIYYTPFSKVLHFNGVTYNSNKNNDENKIARNAELFETNLNKFKNKWDLQLNAIKSTTIEDRIQEIYDHKSIVFFCDIIPEHDRDSGSNRLKEIISAFVNLDFHVSIIKENNFIENEYNEYYQRMGVNVFYEFKKHKNYKNFITKQRLNSSIVWFYGPHVFIKYYNSAKKYFPNAKLVYDMVDIHHLRFERAIEFDSKNKRIKKEAEKSKKIEIKSSNLADYVITISNFENQYMKQFCEDKKLLTISNIHYIKVRKEDLISFNERADLLFIGSIHAPNIDALYFLHNEIMPIVWKKLPNVNVNIIGNVNEKINDIIHEKFIFHGYVPNIEDFFNSNKLMIAPLRYGAGVKGKVGQSFEYYLPVITTTIGGEGMNLINKQNALIEDSASGFANAIIELYSNEELWLKLHHNSEKSLAPFSKEHLKKIILQLNK